MAFTWAGFIQDVEEIPAEVKKVEAEALVWLEKSMPTVDNACADILKALPSIEAILPAVGEIPGLSAVIGAVSTIGQNLINLFGASGAIAQVGQGVTLVQAVGTAAQAATKGGAQTWTQEAEVWVTNLLTNVIKGLTAVKAA